MRSIRKKKEKNAVSRCRSCSSATDSIAHRASIRRAPSARSPWSFLLGPPSGSRVAPRSPTQRSRPLPTRLSAAVAIAADRADLRPIASFGGDPDRRCRAFSSNNDRLASFHPRFCSRPAGTDMARQRPDRSESSSKPKAALCNAKKKRSMRDANRLRPARRSGCDEKQRPTRPPRARSRSRARPRQRDGVTRTRRGTRASRGCTR